MIVYTVRSKSLLDLANEMKSSRLVLSPYFQRNLVWRLVHKKDFIDTILKGYPFPEIFLARGKIDVEKMQATTCVVDGQQRLNSIKEFLDDKFEVDGKTFSKHDVAKKEEFLKYQVAVIELDLEDNDPRLTEIFKRLNRTFYSLSIIEQLSAEYAASEFMIVAKVLCRELFRESESDNDGPFEQNPNIPPESLQWARAQSPKKYQQLILEIGIFSSYEIQRLLHLMFTLNLMAATIGGNFNRNDLAKKYLDQYSQDFAEKESLTTSFEQVAEFILDLKLNSGSYWLNKANIFSLFVLIYVEMEKFVDVGAEEIRKRLDLLEKNLPYEYTAAAKEGVNNKQERGIRDDILRKNLLDIE